MPCSPWSSTNTSPGHSRLASSFLGSPNGQAPPTASRAPRERLRRRDTRIPLKLAVVKFTSNGQSGLYAGGLVIVRNRFRIAESGNAPQIPRLKGVALDPSEPPSISSSSPFVPLCVFTQGEHAHGYPPDAVGNAHRRGDHRGPPAGAATRRGGQAIFNRCGAVGFYVTIANPTRQATGSNWPSRAPLNGDGRSGQKLFTGTSRMVQDNRSRRGFDAIHLEERSS